MKYESFDNLVVDEEQHVSMALWEKNPTGSDPDVSRSSPSPLLVEGRTRAAILCRYKHIDMLGWASSADSTVLWTGREPEGTKRQSVLVPGKRRPA